MYVYTEKINSAVIQYSSTTQYRNTDRYFGTVFMHWLTIPDSASLYSCNKTRSVFPL